MAVIAFDKTISEAEEVGRYLNLSDDAGQAYGSDFPPSGSSLVIVTEDRSYAATKRGHDRIGGDIRDWYADEDVHAGEVVRIIYDDTRGSIFGGTPVMISFPTRERGNQRQSGIDNTSGNQLGGTVANENDQDTRHTTEGTESVEGTNLGRPDLSSAVAGAASYPDTNNNLPRDLKGVTVVEIADAIVANLVDRVRQSCRKQYLTRDVLNYLGARTRGRPRRDFQTKVLEVVRFLRSHGVMEQYKTQKSTRVRLLKDSQARYQACRRKLEKKVNSSSPGDGTHPVLMEKTSSRQLSLFGENGLPELPTENKDLLDVMTGENEITPMSASSHECEDNGEETSDLGVDILKIVDKGFSNRPGIENRMFSREVVLEAKLTERFGASVSVRYYDVANKNVIIRSLLPPCFEPITEFLTLFAEAGYEGRLCIEQEQGNPALVIKKELELHRYLPKEVISIIEQIIHQSAKICHIIERHTFES